MFSSETIAATLTVASSYTATALQTTTSLVPETTSLPSHLMVPTSPFDLWSIALLTLSVMLVTSMVFIMVVLLCRAAKEKMSKQYTYHTRSPQGSFRLQGSVSHIKNQESLEVTNAHYRRQVTTSVISDNNNTGSCVESSVVHQSQEEEQAQEEEAELRRGNETLHGTTEEVAVCLGEERACDTLYENTRAIQQQQQQSSSGHQHTRRSREYTHSHSTDNSFQNNRFENVSTVTQETHQQSQGETAAAVVVNQTDTITATPTFEDGSSLHDVPGFQDPEVIGDEEDGERLRVNAPPNIYSSQILSTVVNDGADVGHGYSKKEAEEHGTETVANMGMDTGSAVATSHGGMDIILNHDSPLCILQDFDDSLQQGERVFPSQSSENQTEADNHRMPPEGATEGFQECTGVSTTSITMLQHDPQATDEDVVYDRPVTKQVETSPAGDDDIKLPRDVDPKSLFDDPGYTEGMIRAGNGGNSEASGPKLVSQLQHQLPSQELTSSSPFGLSLRQEHLETTNPSALKMQRLSVRLGQVPGMKSTVDPLAVLDYDDSELSELDPVIATCLRSPNLSDIDDEIAISEV